MNDDIEAPDPRDPGFQQKAEPKKESLGTKLKVTAFTEFLKVGIKQSKLIFTFLASLFAGSVGLNGWHAMQDDPVQEPVAAVAECPEPPACPEARTVDVGRTIKIYPLKSDLDQIRLSIEALGAQVASQPTPDCSAIVDKAIHEHWEQYHH